MFDIDYISDADRQFLCPRCGLDFICCADGTPDLCRACIREDKREDRRTDHERRTDLEHEGIYED